MHAITISGKKEAVSLHKSGAKYIGVIRGRKRRPKYCNCISISKDKDVFSLGLWSKGQPLKSLKCFSISHSFLEDHVVFVCSCKPGYTLIFLL